MDGMFFMFFLYLGCSSGDVGLFDDDIYQNVPMVFWKGKFLYIQATGFADNDNGANLFCKTMGFTNGKITMKEETKMTTLMIGVCDASDVDLMQCTGGANTYNVSDSNVNADGSNAAVSIECEGGTSIKNPTCEG